ncbi:MAG: hypothetical protein HRS57_01895 [Mycoplasmataceae bacterium]|nr:hypothetical protein [Mycoplasmataceae bacterium]
MKSKERSTNNYKYDNVYETNTKKNKIISIKKEVGLKSSDSNSKGINSKTKTKKDIRKNLENELLEVNKRILNNKKIISNCQECAFLVRQEYQIAKKVREEYLSKHGLWEQVANTDLYISAANKKQIDIYDKRIKEIRSFANVKTCKVHRINTLENMIDFKKVLSLEAKINKLKYQNK